MKGLKPFLSLGLGLLACALLAGCAGQTPANGPGALNIAQFTLSDGVPGVPYRQLLIASGGLTPYTWTITAGSLPPGLNLTTDGIISGNITVDPGVTLPHTYNFTAKVTDSQTPVAAFNTLSTSITVNPVLSLTSSPLPAGSVGASYQATVTAMNGITPYSYAIAFGSLPDGLTLDQGTGTISGTPTTAGEFSFTIQASDAVAEVATAAFTITIVGRLQGGYVISFNGWLDGQPFYLVGSFQADGNGNITSGVIDQNGPFGVATNLPLIPGQSGNSGSFYSIPSGTNFGTLTLATTQGPTQYNIVVSNTADSKVILADPTHPTAYGSGAVKKQSATTLSLTGNSTNYTFGFFGNDANGGRYAGAGMFALRTTPLAITGGVQDTNDAGTASGEVSINSGTLATPDSVTGRETLSLTTASGTTNYVYYVVSPTELAAVQTDAGSSMTLMSILQQQSAGISGVLSLCKQGQTCQSALSLNGLSSTAPTAAVGVATFDGSGNIARTDTLPAYYLDQSVGGTYSAVSYTAGTYVIDATCGPIATSCGRVTVTLAGAPAQPVWYLVTTGQGFVIDADPAVTSGTLLPQSTTAFTISSILGSYLGGTITPVAPTITHEIDVVTTPPPGGNLLYNYETNGPGEPGGGLPNLNFEGPYNCGGTATDATCSAMGAAFGRFELTTTSDAGAPVLQILYITGAGASGSTGSKTGLSSINVGKYDGTPDPNPRVSTYGR